MADATGGHLNWSGIPAENILKVSVVIAGRQFTTTGLGLSGEFAAGGFAVPGSGGRTIRQFATEHPDAPLSVGPSSFSFRIGQMTDIEDERLLLAIPAQAAIQDIGVWLNKEINDTWVITAGRSQWTISHRFAFATALATSFTLPTPAVRVLNADNTISSTLTVVAAAPAAGEVQIDETTDGFTMTTFAGDLDADAGKRLVVFYQPLLACTLEPATWNRPQTNLLFNDLTLLVAAPARDWGADTV